MLKFGPLPPLIGTPIQKPGESRSRRNVTPQYWLKDYVCRVWLDVFETFSYHSSCFGIIKFVETLNRTIRKICLFVCFYFALFSFEGVYVIRSKRDVAYALVWLLPSSFIFEYDHVLLNRDAILTEIKLRFSITWLFSDSNTTVSFWVCRISIPGQNGTIRSLRGAMPPEMVFFGV